MVEGHCAIEAGRQAAVGSAWTTSSSTKVVPFELSTAEAGTWTQISGGISSASISPSPSASSIKLPSKVA
eukprot:4389651-Amphidinium_carterae.1